MPKKGHTEEQNLRLRVPASRHLPPLPESMKSYSAVCGSRGKGHAAQRRQPVADRIVGVLFGRSRALLHLRELVSIVVAVGLGHAIQCIELRLAVAGVVVGVGGTIQSGGAALVQHRQQPREAVVGVVRVHRVRPRHLLQAAERVVGESELARPGDGQAIEPIQAVVRIGVAAAIGTEGRRLAVRASVIRVRIRIAFARQEGILRGHPDQPAHVVEGELVGATRGATSNDRHHSKYDLGQSTSTIVSTACDRLRCLSENWSVSCIHLRRPHTPDYYQ